MKKNLILLLIPSILLACTTFSVSAQEKGEMSLGGQLNLSTGSIAQSFVNNRGLREETKSPSNTSFMLGVGYDYFAAKNFRIAIWVGYELAAEPSEKVGSKWYYNTANLFHIDPSIAYYVKIVNNFFYTPTIYLPFNIGYVKVPVSESTSTVVPCLGGGIYAYPVSFEFRITEHFAMECGYGYLGFTSTKVQNVNTGADIITNTFAFKLNSLSICAKYYF